MATADIIEWYRERERIQHEAAMKVLEILGPLSLDNAVGVMDRVRQTVHEHAKYGNCR